MHFILIESQWNLNATVQEEQVAEQQDINRITVEFKFNTCLHYIISGTNINRITVEFKYMQEKASRIF